MPVLLFFFNDTATTEIYTLSLHDALPISGAACRSRPRASGRSPGPASCTPGSADRKSTRLNSSHSQISDAVFCLKKKSGLGVHRVIYEVGRSLRRAEQLTYSSGMHRVSHC